MSDSLCCQQVYCDVKYATVHARLNSGLFVGIFRVKDKQELWLIPGFHAPGLDVCALNWHPIQTPHSRYWYVS